MDNSHSSTRLPKRSKGYFWIGVGCICLGAPSAVFVIVMIIQYPTTVVERCLPPMSFWLFLYLSGFIIFPAVFLVWLGMHFIKHTKFRYLAQLGEGIDFPREKLVGVVPVIEEHIGWRGVHRDLRFYSSGIWSPDPPEPGRNYTIPYADISKIRVYKAFGFKPRLEICTNFNSKHRFDLQPPKIGMKVTHRDFLKCCRIVNLACSDKLETKPKYLKDALARKPRKRKTDLQSLTGKMASSPASRLSLYRSALLALIEAKGNSSIAFGCKERPECYLDFWWDPDTHKLTGLVSGEPVLERGREILLRQGFKPSEEFSPAYYQDFESPEPRKLGELVENVLSDVLDCPDSYTAQVLIAAYQE